MRVFAATAALLVILAGCTSVVPANPGPRLSGTAWVVTQLNGEPTLPDYQPTANFGVAGQLFGDTGCNQYNAHYRQTGSSLTISQPAQTMMACGEPGRSVQESKFTTALVAVTAVREVGDKLELLDAGGRVILLLAPVPPLSLAGTSWVLGGIVDGSTVSAPVAGSTTTVQFAADTVSGQACNSFSASYTLHGDRLRVGPMAVTEMACTEPGVMAQEALVLDILGGASTAELTRDLLLISDADGRGLQLTKG